MAKKISRLSIVMLAASLSIPSASFAGYALIDLNPRTSQNSGASVNNSLDLDASVNSNAANAGATSTTNVNTDVNVGGGAQGSSEPGAGINSEIDSASQIDMTADAVGVGQSLRINRVELLKEFDPEGELEIDTETNTRTETRIDHREVTTNGELKAYAQSSMRNDKGIEEMNFGSDTVEVRYRQQGRLLALIPIWFTVTARAHADGTVELDYPWYSFLTVDNQNQIETELKVAIDSALRSRMVGSVSAEGETENPQFTAGEAAEVAHQIQAVLRSSLRAQTESSSTNTSAVE